MQLASYILSLCLHAALILLIWFWPSSPPLRLDQRPVMISLVEGAPGGNRTPSPILGHMGEQAEGPLAPTPPAPQSEIAAPAREAARPEPVPAPPREAQPEQKRPEAVPIPRKDEPKPEPMPEPKPEPKPEPRPEPKPEPKKEEPKKPEPKKPEPKKPEPKKQEKPAPKKTDPVAAALQQARKATSRAQSGDRGNAIEQALAQAQRRAGGNRGGGGGEGDGPGGGGLGDVYMGQVMLAVRPNWGFASAGRLNLACVVRVKVDMQGKVLQAVVSQSSGNAQFDASAVNAVIRTGQAGEFPPPPSQEYTDLDLVFTFDELMGRR
ncbi:MULTISPECIES: energy transducer TonB [unclassified Desulfovibrio]|uniref:energy transducer TonB n=1 Tax=unclassified Desulfovibrio TaxID=2593640 RepID=UPI0013EABFAF|nr:MULTISPECIES: energy transducer TonB [unclassified Desulfovibrio]